MAKLLKTIVLIMFISFTLISCASNKNKVNTKNGQNTETQFLGVILPTKDEPRWLQDEARFQEVLASKGYNVEILFSDGSSDTERLNIEELVRKGADVIVICPQDGQVAAEAVEKAKKSGAKIIAYDRPIINTDAIDYFVTFDSLAVGRAQGNYLIEYTDSKKNLPLYLYAGSVADYNAYLYFEGAWEVLQPKIADGTFLIANSEEALKLADKSELTVEEANKIITEITTNWNVEDTKKKAQLNLSTVKSDLKGEVFILSPNDSSARALVDIFTADTEIEDYHITGQDAEKESVQYIIDKKQSMTVFKDVRILANDAIDMSVTLLSGQVPYTTSTYNNGKIDIPTKQTDVKVVDSENVKYELIDSGYYDANEFANLK